MRYIFIFFIYSNLENYKYKAKYIYNSNKNDFIELWWDGGLCVKINGSDTARFNADAWL